MTDAVKQTSAAASPAAASLSEADRAALAWYARTMAGAPVQPGDLEAVADLALPVALTVQRAALRDLQWTDATQSLGPQLRQIYEADQKNR